MINYIKTVPVEIHGTVFAIHKIRILESQFKKAGVIEKR